MSGEEMRPFRFMDGERIGYTDTELNLDPDPDFRNRIRQAKFRWLDERTKILWVHDQKLGLTASTLWKRRGTTMTPAEERTELELCHSTIFPKMDWEAFKLLANSSDSRVYEVWTVWKVRAEIALTAKTLLATNLMTETETGNAGATHERT
jgi:hypothetical protein